VTPGERAFAGLRAGGVLLDQMATDWPDGTLAVLDLDRFGRVSARHGTGTGDALLAAIERGLRAAVAGTGHAVALGGDQFLVLVSGRVDPAALGRRLLTAVKTARVRTGRGRATWVSASAGLAGWAGPDRTVDAALRSAARALTAAKSAGGNHWAVS
jgi:diguanylate cyclase (GGDEF)-like protein